MPSFFVSSASDIYVDSELGNDANPGTLASPKQGASVNLVKSLLASGKRVFMRGTWTNQDFSGVSASGWELAPYGDGATLDARVRQQASWTNVSGSRVWKRSVGTVGGVEGRIHRVLLGPSGPFSEGFDIAKKQVTGATGASTDAKVVSLLDASTSPSQTSFWYYDKSTGTLYVRSINSSIDPWTAYNGVWTVQDGPNAYQSGLVSLVSCSSIYFGPIVLLGSANPFQMTGGSGTLALDVRQCSHITPAVRLTGTNATQLSQLTLLNPTVNLDRPKEAAYYAVAGYDDGNGTRSLVNSDLIQATGIDDFRMYNGTLSGALNACVNLLTSSRSIGSFLMSGTKFDLSRSNVGKAFILNPQSAITSGRVEYITVDNQPNASVLMAANTIVTNSVWRSGQDGQLNGVVDKYEARTWTLTENAGAVHFGGTSGMATMANTWVQDCIVYGCYTSPIRADLNGGSWNSANVGVQRTSFLHAGYGTTRMLVTVPTASNLQWLNNQYDGYVDYSIGQVGGGSLVTSVGGYLGYEAGTTTVNTATKNALLATATANRVFPNTSIPTLTGAPNTQSISLKVLDKTDAPVANWTTTGITPQNISIISGSIASASDTQGNASLSLQSSAPGNTSVDIRANAGSVTTSLNVTVKPNGLALPNVQPFPFTTRVSIDSAIRNATAGGAANAGCTALLNVLGSTPHLFIVQNKKLLLWIAYSGAPTLTSNAITFPTAYTIVSAVHEASSTPGTLYYFLCNDANGTAGVRGTMFGTNPAALLTGLLKPGKGFGVKQLSIGFEPTIDAATASTWTPNYLFSSNEAGFWYDISDLSTLFQNSNGTTPAVLGSPVGYVGDKSGRGNHAVQSVASKRPTLAQDAFGKYYLNFDGVDDFLTPANVTFAYPFLAVFGVKTNGTGSANVILDGGAATGPEVAVNAANNLDFNTGGSVQTGLNGLPVVFSNYVQTGPVSGSVAINSHTENAANPTGATASGALALFNQGGNSTFKGAWYGGLVRQGVTSSANDRTNARWFVGQKTGIALTPGTIPVVSNVPVYLYYTNSNLAGYSFRLSTATMLSGWTQVGIAFNSPPSSVANVVAVYEWTTTTTEGTKYLYDTLAATGATSGWTQGPLAFYVFSGSTANAVAVYANVATSAEGSFTYYTVNQSTLPSGYSGGYLRYYAYAPATPVVLPTSGGTGGTGAQLTRTDSRRVAWISPNESYSENYTWGSALSQASVFPNPPLSADVYNNGILSFSHETDPDQAGTNRFRYYIRPANMTIWAPAYVPPPYGTNPGGGLDPTWRSEIAIGDQANACAIGVPYMIAIGVKIGSDAAAASNSISLFDIHAPDGTRNIGPGPISILQSGLNATIYNTWNALADGYRLGGVSYGWNQNVTSVTLDTTNWHYFILDFKWHWDINQGPYFRCHYARGDGNLTTVINDTTHPLGYNEPTLNLYMKGKSGIYMFYPLSDGSSSRTIYGKGIYVFQNTGGLTKEQMLSLVRP